MIAYTDSLINLTADHLQGGFFVGWPNPPAPQTHLRILQGSYRVWLAVDTQSRVSAHSEMGQVVGFINAISDGVLAAFIPLLEVLPAYQGQSIGSELTQRMLHSLRHLYSIDLLCDADVQPFYERLGMEHATGMLTRNYERQSGGK